MGRRPIKGDFLNSLTVADQMYKRRIKGQAILSDFDNKTVL